MKVVAVFATESRIISYISSDNNVPKLIINSETFEMSKILSHYRRMAFERPGYRFRLTILNNDQSILHEFEMKPELDSLWVDANDEQERNAQVLKLKLASRNC